MSRPYENIYLGNFILTLGYVAAKNGLELSKIASELLQQTPDDHTIGDLLTNWEGRNFIFEFKRDESKVKSELLKPQRSKLFKEFENEEKSSLLNISKSCHFVCFPHTTEPTLLFMPYAFIKDSSAQDSLKCLDLTSFCNKLLDASPSYGVPYRGFSEYLNFLISFSDSQSASSGGAGVIMNISNDGKIKIIEAGNLRILSQTLDHEPDPPARDRSHSIGIGR